MSLDEPGPSHRTEERSAQGSWTRNRPAQILAAVSALAIIAAVWGWSAADSRGKARDEAREKTVAVEQELTTAKLANQTLTADLTSARTETETAKQNFAGLGVNLQRSATQLQEVTKQRDTLVQERDRIQQQFTELQGKVGEHTAVQANLARARNDVDQARTQLTGIQTEVQQREQRLQQLQATLSDLERQQAQAQEALTTAQQKAQEAMDQVSVSGRKLVELQAAAAQASQNLSQITADIAQQTKVLSEARDQSAAAAQQAVEMNQARADLQNQVNDLQRQRATLEEETARRQGVSQGGDPEAQSRSSGTSGELDNQNDGGQSNAKRP